MRKFASMLAVALLGAALAAAEPVEYQVDPGASTVNYVLGGNLHTVHGTFKVKRGAIRFDAANGTAGGEVIVDPATGDSGNGSRDGRMKKSILEVEKYPEIAFSPDKIIGPVSAQGASKVQVHGTFRLHGASHEITIPAEVEMSGDRMTATLHFEIPYVSWGMKNPSTLFLRVDEKVTIEIKASARKVTQTSQAR